jgi:hypothetical protein
MTAKQEAAAMVLSFLGIVGNNMKYAKECALVAVNKIINILNSDINPLVNYWYEVKQEIEAI